MYVYGRDRFAGAKYHTQADLEESLFGGGQEEVVEFGADQCKHFVCDVYIRYQPFHSGILVRNDATRDRLQQRLRNSIVMSVLTSPRWLFT